MDIRDIAIQRAQLTTDLNDELRHAAHSVIMALEALRLEVRASGVKGSYRTSVWHEADILGSNALLDTIAAEQMTLDDITIAENMVSSGTSPEEASAAIDNLNDRIEFLNRHLG